MWRTSLGAVLLTLVVMPGQSSAQGLIWNVPEEGAWVRYEGTYSQLVRRPNSTEGDLELSWTRHLTIKSLNSVEDEFEGTAQPCRWIEIKVITAQAAAVLNPGPGGTRVYKVLVPEAEIRGQINDERNIIVSHLPVVRGYRKLGNEAPQPIESGVLQIYPAVSYLRHYRSLEQQSADPEAVDTAAGPMSGTALRGEMTMESPITRSTNTAQMWRTDDVPFGLAKWIIKDVREEKFATQPRAEFRETMEVNIEMSVAETGIGAETELDVE